MTGHVGPNLLSQTEVNVAYGPHKAGSTSRVHAVTDSQARGWVPERVGRPWVVQPPQQQAWLLGLGL